MGITKYLENAKIDFVVFGQVHNEWGPLVVGVDYEAFVVKRKWFMRTIKELNKSKVPFVRIDESLDKYDNVVLFPDKLAKANEMLRTIGLPKINSKRNHA